MANDHDSAEDKEGNDSQAGSFLGFVLLSKPEWNLSQLKTDLKTDWDIDWNADENELKTEKKTQIIPLLSYASVI